MRCLLVLFFAVASAFAEDSFDIFPGLPVEVIDTQNALCKEQTTLYVNHLKNLTLWAHEMYDASVHSSVGILRGNPTQFGQFDECLTSKAPFRKKYCLAVVTAAVPEPNPPRNPKSLYYDKYESVLRRVYDNKDSSQQPRNYAMLGWCIPAACSSTDLQNHLNIYLTNFTSLLKSQNVNYSATIDPTNCQEEDESKYFDHLDITFCLITVILFLMLIVSSIYEGFQCTEENQKQSEKSPLYRLGVAFCARKNFKKLFVADESNPALNILYGMRVVCIFMIIIDHRFGTHLASAVMNFDLVEEQYRSAFGTIFFHGDLFVDSFFILSGLLVTYCLLVQFDKKFINPGFIVLMRYIRLTPVYAFVIFYYATMLKYTGFGPMWKPIIGQEVADCRTNWWTNLLYISNYINTDHMCMVHSWYLPCDFHYFILALILCITIYKHRKIGLAILLFTTFLSMLIPFIIGYINERPAVLFFYPDFLRAPKMHPDFLLTYSKSHTRAAPYFIGMIAGYIYYKSKDYTIKINRLLSYIITLVSLGLMIGAFISGMIFYDEDYQYNAFESSLYSATHRAVWAVGSVGVLYIASYGHAEFINKFLSWTPWIPLSKLVYGAYLAHMQFQMRSMAQKASSDEVSYFNIVSYGLSDIVLAFSTAFLLYLTIEAPFRNIFSILLAPPKPVKKPSKNESLNEVTCDSHL